MDGAAVELELPRVGLVGQSISVLPGPGVPSALLLLWTQEGQGGADALSRGSAEEAAGDSRLRRGGMWAVARGQGAGWLVCGGPRRHRGVCHQAG